MGPETAFDDHDGAVHHHADGHHQSDGRDHVQRKVEQVHQGHSQQQGQGDGAAHDEAGLYIAEKNEQHQHGQDHAQQQSVADLFQGLEHDVRAVVDGDVFDGLVFGGQLI